MWLNTLGEYKMVKVLLLFPATNMEHTNNTWYIMYVQLTFCVLITSGKVYYI